MVESIVGIACAIFIITVILVPGGSEVFILIRPYLIAQATVIGSLCAWEVYSGTRIDKEYQSC